MKIGLLGLGSIGFRHARNLRMLGHEVFGYDPKNTDTYLGNGTYKICRSAESAIEGRDAIVIATPTDQHYNDWACIPTGKPVFMEKPLCSYTDLDFFAAETEGVLNAIFLGYMLRFHPCVKAAKNWIDAGHIGKPLWANFICGQFNDKPDYLRDGVVLNWSHEIDLALYLLGPAKVVAASVETIHGENFPLAKSGGDIIADFVLEHDSGARSTIHLDYVTKTEIRESWIVGSEKNLGLDMLGRRVSFGKMVQEFGGDWNADYVDEMQAFIHWAEGTDDTTPPVQWATGEDGLRVLKICQQVRQKAGLE